MKVTKEEALIVLGVLAKSNFVDAIILDKGLVGVRPCITSMKARGTGGDDFAHGCVRSEFAAFFRALADEIEGKGDATATDSDATGDEW